MLAVNVKRNDQVCEYCSVYKIRIFFSCCKMACFKCGNKIPIVTVSKNGQIFRLNNRAANGDRDGFMPGINYFMPFLIFALLISIEMGLCHLFYLYPSPSLDGDQGALRSWKDARGDFKTSRLL